MWVLTRGLSWISRTREASSSGVQGRQSSSVPSVGGYGGSELSVVLLTLGMYGQ